MIAYSIHTVQLLRFQPRIPFSSVVFSPFSQNQSSLSFSPCPFSRARTPFFLFIKSQHLHVIENEKKVS